jgi:hypothetical protein
VDVSSLAVAAVERPGFAFGLEGIMAEGAAEAIAKGANHVATEGMTEGAGDEGLFVGTTEGDTEGLAEGMTYFVIRPRLTLLAATTKDDRTSERSTIQNSK